MMGGTTLIMASTAVSRAGSAKPAEKAGPASSLDMSEVVRELAAVAAYIGHIKLEIAALRANELYRDRIPMAHRELGGIVRTTATATNTIMTAAEEILGSDEASLECYRDRVESKLLEIFEACAFQDITGQRIEKVVNALVQVERRLGRFAHAVNARDAGAGSDPDDALRHARREVLLVHGPAEDGEGIAQADIDRMFG
jgi:chemotaxis protein CheZ